MLLTEIAVMLGLAAAPLSGAWPPTFDPIKQGIVQTIFGFTTASLCRDAEWEWMEIGDRCHVDVQLRFKPKLFQEKAHEAEPRRIGKP